VLPIYIKGNGEPSGLFRNKILALIDCTFLYNVLWLVVLNNDKL